jgi:hypothetical protein
VEKLFPPPPDPLEERVTAVEQKNVEQDAAILGLNDRLTVVESPPVPTGNITAKVLNADQVEITGLNCVKLTTSGSGLKRIVTCGH